MLISGRHYRDLPDGNRRMSSFAEAETYACTRKNGGPSVDKGFDEVSHHEGFTVQQHDEHGFVVTVAHGKKSELTQLLPAWAIRPAKPPRRLSLDITRS